MPDRSRWDPEMAAFTAMVEAEAAKHPPVKVELPLAPHRRINDLLGMLTASGGPVMADTADRFVDARGRRIFCRVFRPVLDRMLPTLVYFHGGGWVWANVDTHDRMTREYAASGQVAVVSVDYALSPEAKFPQALEECAAVVRFLAERGEEWGLDPARLVLGGDSAGGNLALATALLLRDTAGPPLRGVLANYPVSDARFDTPSYREFGGGRGPGDEAARSGRGRRDGNFCRSRAWFPARDRIGAKGPRCRGDGGRMDEARNAVTSASEVNDSLNEASTVPRPITTMRDPRPTVPQRPSGRLPRRTLHDHVIGEFPRLVLHAVLRGS